MAALKNGGRFFVKRPSAITRRPRSDSLVKARSAPDERPIVDPDIPGEQAIVRDHDAIAELAVVAEMGADHEEIAVAQWL